MKRLSVNINKVALIRNARGGNMPNLVQFAIDCETFGAQGITVHPRPDQRHITYADIPALKSVVTTEFNIEGYPSEDFLEMVLSSRPHQVTLVPDLPSALTSDHGWDTHGQKDFLVPIVARLQDMGIRVSLFVDPDPSMIAGAAALGVDRIELYTGPYAHAFYHDPTAAVYPYVQAAKAAEQFGLGVNAGHDLNLDNLAYFQQQIPNLLEVSIGHALICDALYYGIQNTIQMYLRLLER